MAGGLMKASVRRLVIVGAVAGALLLLVVLRFSPRDRSVAMTSPTVCAYPLSGLDRTTLVECAGGANAVVDRDQVLVSAAASASDTAPPPIPEATLGGQLHVSRAWFGGYRYEFVSSGGRVTELQVTDRHVGALPDPERR